MYIQSQFYKSTLTFEMGGDSQDCKYVEEKRNTNKNTKYTIVGGKINLKYYISNFHTVNKSFFALRKLVQSG